MAPVADRITPVAEVKASRRISQSSGSSSISRAGQFRKSIHGGHGQPAGEAGEFGQFLAGEFAGLQNRVLARLEQDLAGGDVQRLLCSLKAWRASRKEAGVLACEEDVAGADGRENATARWGSLVTAVIEANDLSESTRRRSMGETLEDYIDEELWKPHPDWQTMSTEESKDRDSRGTAGISKGDSRSCLVQGLFVDQLQTAYSGSDHGLGMFERSSGSWLARRVMHPDGARAICWCFVGMLLMCYETVAIPLEAAGLNDRPSAMLAIPILVYWLLDLPVHALTGYMHDVTLEMRPSYTLRHYAKTWLAMDLMLVSGDLVFLVLDTRGAAQSLRLIRLLRMARLVRIQRWHRMLKMFMIGRQSQMLELTLRLAGLVLSLLVICHLTACTWYGLGDQLSGSDGWLDEGSLRSKSNAHKYSVAFHWTITQFTPSTNNINPETTEERCFAIVVVIMGMVVFSTFLTNLTTTVNEMRSYGSDLTRERHRLLVFTKQRDLTHVISQKIMTFFDTESSRESRVVIESDFPLISQLPKAVQMGLRMELYFPSLRGHPLFSVITASDATFSLHLCTTMSEERYMAQQVVFVDGTEADVAYITRSGFVEYIYQSASDFRTASFSVAPGSWLAECALWVRWNHRGLLVAHSSTNLVIMDCTAVRSLVGTHSPDLRGMLKCFAILFAHEMDLNGKLATDLAPPTDFLKDLMDRAMNFTASQLPLSTMDVSRTRAMTPRGMTFGQVMLKLRK